MGNEKIHSGVFYGSDFIGEAELNAVTEVMKSQSLFRYYGRNLLHKADEFEEDLKKYFDCSHALAVSSGTAAIKCAVKALGIGDGDEVIVPAYGFIATAGAVASMGATPIFADIDKTLNINIEDIKKKVTKNTKAIIVVHLFGACSDIEAIVEYAHSNNIYVIEDTAQAIGATFHGRKLGTIGDMGCFSFQANKIVCTGEGGAIITNNQEYFNRAKMFHDQGGFRNGNSFPRWDMPDCTLGENLRMSELHAAIGIEQLKKIHRILDGLRERKQQMKERLLKYHLDFREVICEECGITVIFFAENESLRDRLKMYFDEKNVITTYYYNSSIYECGLFGEVTACTFSDTIAKRILGLPVLLNLSNKKFHLYLDRIDAVFQEILSEKNRLIKKIFTKDIEVIQEYNSFSYNIDYSPQNFILRDKVMKEGYIGVAGGPCIDRCERDVRKLKINIYIDILSPIEYSVQNNLPCFLYLDTPIEFYQCCNDKYLHKEYEEWIALADRVESFIYRLCDVSRLTNVKVIRRDKCYRLLDQLSQKYLVKDESLFDLYNLVSGRISEKIPEYLLLNFKRVITAYQPKFISEYLSLDELEEIHIVESLSQSKAINKASVLDSRIKSILYIDTPSLSGNNRMHRTEHGSIYIFDDMEFVKFEPLFEKYLEQTSFNYFYQVFEVKNFIELTTALREVWDVREK